MNEYYLNRAWTLYHADNYGDAIDQLKQLLGQEPNHAEAHGLLAMCLLAQKRVGAAEFEIKLALQGDPMQPFLHLVQAEILLCKNQRKQALQACDRAQELAPESAEPLLKKVRILVFYDNFREAKAILDTAASLAPNAYTVPLLYSQIALGLGEIKLAETFAREALGRNPQAEEANVLMGKILLAQGDAKAAAEHARFIILNNPDSQAGLTLLANIKARGNLFLGFWWRFNNYLTNMSQLRQVSWLIGGFLLFNLLAQILKDMGYSTLSSLLSTAWLGLVIYSWVAIPMYTRMVKKELAKFQFNRNF